MKELYFELNFIKIYRIFESAMIFIPRDDVLSPSRSEKCAISNYDSCLDELQQRDSAIGKRSEETSSSENLLYSVSVQELTRLFSKLSLHDAVDNVEIGTQAQSNLLETHVKEERPKLKPKQFSSSNFQALDVEKSKEVQPKNMEFLNCFSLHFKPLSCTLGGPVSLFVFKRTNIGNKGIWREKKDSFHHQEDGNFCFATTENFVADMSSFAANHSFIEPLIYRYRSRFAVFLSYLLARAGRLKEDFDHSVRETDGISSIYEDNWIETQESTNEEQRKETEFPFLLMRRVPSEKQGNYPKEEQFNLDDSQTITSGTTLLTEHNFFIEDVSLLRSELGTLNVAQWSEEPTEVKEQGRFTPKEDEWFYPGKELTLLKNLEQEESLAYHEDELTSIQEGRTSSSAQWTYQEEDLTLIQEQGSSTLEQAIYLGEEFTLVAEPRDTFVNEATLNLEGQGTYLEGQQYYLEEEETHVEENSLVKAK